jgi:hypothetical protein
MMLAGTMTISTAAHGDGPVCEPAEYWVIDLHEDLPDPELIPHSIAYAINDFGEVTGDLVGFGHGAFVWLFRSHYGLSGRTTLDLADEDFFGWPPPPEDAIGRDINIHGQIIGNSEEGSTANPEIILWELASTSYTNLSSSMHLNATGIGHAISNTSPPVIVGTRDVGLPDPGGFRYELNVKLEKLFPTPTVFRKTVAFDVSDENVAVGYSTDGEPTTFDPCPTVELPVGSTRWNAGPFEDNEVPGDGLTGLGAESRGRFAYGINTTHHHIVGESRDPDTVPPSGGRRSGRRANRTTRKHCRSLIRVIRMTTSPTRSASRSCGRSLRSRPKSMSWEVMRH